MTWGRDREGLKFGERWGNKRLLHDGNVKLTKMKEFPNYSIATDLPLKVSFKEKKSEAELLARPWARKDFSSPRTAFSSSMLQVLPFQIFFSRPKEQHSKTSDPVLLSFQLFLKHPFEMFSWTCYMDIQCPPCSTGLKEGCWKW